MRDSIQTYPDFTWEIKAIKEAGITEALVNRIINKHLPNGLYNRELLNRYRVLRGWVPITNRQPRFEAEEAKKREIINHRLNNDFFGEIVDFKVGYFAGVPISYSYSTTQESLEDTGEKGGVGESAKEDLKAAKKQLSDFVALNNMFDADMEATKYASICGYAGRLLYLNPEGQERVMILPPEETVILSETGDITEPTFGLRYYTVTDLEDRERTKAVFYDGWGEYHFEGELGDLHQVESKPHLFGLCPLQGIPNNAELVGDAECVLELIDAYDRVTSDINNEVDSFANAYMVFENIAGEAGEEAEKAQHNGIIQYYSGALGGKIYFLTKDINDGFLEHHLERLENNIYRYSKTPNLNDESFGTASGVALKFKLTGTETKCGMFEAKLQKAGVYLFRLLAHAWGIKGIAIDPLQCVMEFKRNFPLDILGEAQAAQALVSAGVPEEIAYQVSLSCVDDIDYLMQVKESEKEKLPSLAYNLPEETEEGTERGGALLPR